MLRNILHWFLYSNVFIGLCAMAYTARGFILTGTDVVPVLPVLFAGCSTLFTYLLIRVAAAARIREYTPDTRWSFFLSNLKWMQVIMTLAGCAVVGLFFCLPRTAQISLLFPGIVSVIYGLPIRFGKHSVRLRDIGIIKIFLIAFVWAFIGSVLPVSYAGPNWFNLQTLFLFIADFLFILAITLPFDIKDMHIDAQHNVRTIPVLLGKELTNSLSMVLLFLGAVLYTLYFRYFFPSELDFSIPLVISSIISGMTIILAQKMRNDTVYFGLLDGMLILQWALVATLGI